MVFPSSFRTQYRQFVESWRHSVDTLVLLKDELCPSLYCHLERVKQLHPGSDRIVQVVTLKTAKGSVK